MPAPSDRRYAETHEWHKQDGDTVTIGITRFAVDELTDITFVDFAARRAKGLKLAKPLWRRLNRSRRPASFIRRCGGSG